MHDVTYTPDPQLRQSRRLLRSMARDLMASRELAWRLFLRNLSAQYRQTFLGYVWVFLPAVATTGIWAFLNAQNIFNVGQTDIPYPAYVLIGTLLWQGFVDALNAPLKQVMAAKPMLAKVNFPHEALILAGLGEVLFNFMVRLVLAVVVFVGFEVTLPLTILLAPIGILALILLGLVIGILLTPLGVLYQDVQQGIMLITGLWFFLTPVVYPAPTDWPASLLARLNPVSPLLMTTRDWMTTGHTAQLGGFVLMTALTLIMAVLGWLIYRLAKPHLIERVSA